MQGPRYSDDTLAALEPLQDLHLSLENRSEIPGFCFANQEDEKKKSVFLTKGNGLMQSTCGWRAGSEKYFSD